MNIRVWIIEAHEFCDGAISALLHYDDKLLLSGSIVMECLPAMYQARQQNNRFIYIEKAMQSDKVAPCCSDVM